MYTTMLHVNRKYTIIEAYIRDSMQHVSINILFSIGIITWSWGCNSTEMLTNPIMLVIFAFIEHPATEKEVSPAGMMDPTWTKRTS